MKSNTLWIDRLRKATFTPREYAIMRLLWKGKKGYEVRRELDMSGQEWLTLAYALNRRLRMYINSYGIEGSHFYHNYALKCPLPRFRPHAEQNPDPMDDPMF